MRLALTFWLACVLTPLVAPGADLETAEQIRACVVENAVGVDNVQAIEMRARNRVGSEQRVRANVYARRDAEGFQRVLVRFSEPEDLEGAAFLLIQRADGNELVVRSTELGTVKRIAREELAGSIAGTDFSYEDFTRMQKLNRPAALRRLADETLDGRAVYVLESQPPEADGSAYERVRAYVDRATCMVSRAELFEPGDKLRKVMTADPGRYRQLGSVWVTRELLLRDLRDGTQTLMVVETFDVDAEIPATSLTVESLAESLTPAAESSPKKD